MRNAYLAAALLFAGCSSSRTLLFHDANGFSTRGGAASVATDSGSYSTDNLSFRLEPGSACSMQGPGLVLEIGDRAYETWDFKILKDSIFFDDFRFPISEVHTISKRRFSFWKTAGLLAAVWFAGAGIASFFFRAD